MKVLIACEYSGRVRDAFIARGHDALSCDLLDTEVPGPHYQGPVEDVLYDDWDMLIAHPPCQFLANSGARWLYRQGTLERVPARWASMRDGAAFFNLFVHAEHIPLRCIENPIMHAHGRRLIKLPPSQIIQPWQFGTKEMKATCLWLTGLPPLVPTDVVGPPPKDALLRRQWAKVHQMPPGPDRWKHRSRTYAGIAAAMANQWG